MLPHSWLTSPLLRRPSPFHRVNGAMTSRARPLVSDASEFTRLRVGSPPKRTVRSSVCTTGLRLPHRPGGAFGRTDWQPRRERGQGAPASREDGGEAAGWQIGERPEGYPWSRYGK